MELNTFELTVCACTLLLIGFGLWHYRNEEPLDRMLGPFAGTIGVAFLIKAYFQHQEIMLLTATIYLIAAGLIAVFIKVYRASKSQPTHSR